MARRELRFRLRFCLYFFEPIFRIVFHSSVSIISDTRRRKRLNFKYAKLCLGIMRNRTTVSILIIFAAILLILPAFNMFSSAQASAVASHIDIHAPKLARCPTNSCSLNWAGYAITSSAGSVTLVSGSFTVPTVSCSSSNAFAAFWVGIDGFNDNTVEQTGITANPCDTSFAPAGYLRGMNSILPRPFMLHLP